ncbi:MATE efflux family protein [Coemansia reversa NRRL 1564]|uniref:MATE efflux family protein n=1 Tax=Coemansia reversa (strain ATCC 12441 / NRRL 1564) TaxID=763665 RepID=A0A2G5BK32_COERN|nr:MATE efflux family protein [Coemansia reversa NRRL 1564]|eukprot:PIA19363.1 MATE efflux family protein [Coemansia reversa NRRL 1564]
MNIQDHRDSPSDAESGTISVCSLETTPLLSTSPSSASLEVAKRDTHEPYTSVARQEVWWMASSSSLTIITLMLQSSFFFVNVMAVSHLGTRELAAMSLSVTCMGIIALAPSFGLMSAMDTFCSTAYTASRDKTLVGFHFQRGLIAAFVHLIVVAPILWNVERLLLALGQEPSIAALSGTYLRINILGVLPWSIFEACKRYLQAQGIMRAGTIIIVIIAPIHWFNNFLFVRSTTYGLGFIGAPIVSVVTNWLVCIGIIIYICNSRATETWGGWDLRALRNMSEYYRLAIPSVITVCAEWVGFELLTIGTSYFGASQLAGQAIILNTVGLIFQISNGLGYGTSPRIGNLIGAGKPRQARIAGDVAIVSSAFIGFLGLLFFIFCGAWWTTVYTLDPDVIREAAKLMPVACVFIISDGLNAVLGAILRGLGRQQASANIYIFGFYFCAVPISLYMGYWQHMEALGLWWGLCIGVMISSILQFVYIYKWVDWKDEVRLCLMRLQNSAEAE